MMPDLDGGAVVAADLVTSSEVHSFLIGRLDEQIADEQDQLVGYIDHVYDAEVRSGDTVAKSDPTAWLDVARGEATSGPSHRICPGPLLTTRSGALAATDLQNHIPPEEFVELIDANRNICCSSTRSVRSTHPGPRPLCRRS